jgi:tetratricopeptide (TPR) repeat protein
MMDKVEKILSLLESGQHDEAIKSYKDILLNGSNEERFVLGEELLHLGFLEEAKELFETLLIAYPEEGELLVLLAEACIELGNEEEAMLALEKIQSTDQSYPQALLLAADLYQMQGLFEVSEQKLLTAKKILPDEVLIDFALAELYMEQGRFTNAIHLYEGVLTKESEIAGTSIHQRLAEAYSAGGAFEEALPHYEQALEDKFEVNTLFGYGFTALHAGYYQTAIEKLTELKNIDREYNSLYLYLAKAYEHEEELAKSLEVIKEGLQFDEFNKDLFFYGGKIALKLNLEDEAESLIREALALDPEFVEAALTLNKLFFHQEKYDDVLEIIDIMNEHGVEEPQLLWDEANALANVERYSEALNKYQLAYNFFKNQQEFLTDYGYFLIEEGKTQDAAEIFSMLLERDPSNEEFAELVQRFSEDV